MAGRGPQSFKKRQREQQRKEKHQQKIAERLQRKRDKVAGVAPSEEEPEAHEAQHLAFPAATPE